MRVGISSWTYAWHIGVPGYPHPGMPMDALALIERAHALRAQVVQIADNLPLDAWAAPALDALAGRAAAYGIALEVGTRGVHLDKLYRYIDIARRLRATLIRTLPHEANERPCLVRVEQSLRALLPTLRAHGLTLALENHDDIPAKALGALVARLDDPHIGICLDPANNLAQGESTADVLAALATKTVNFHCKDYTIRRKASNLGFDVEGCAVGDGLLNLSQCAQAFGKRDMSYIVELWTPWQDGIEQTCALERAWAACSVRHLLQLQAAGTL